MMKLLLVLINFTLEVKCDEETCENVCVASPTLISKTMNSLWVWQLHIVHFLSCLCFCGNGAVLYIVFICIWLCCRVSCPMSNLCCIFRPKPHLFKWGPFILNVSEYPMTLNQFKSKFCFGFLHQLCWINCFLTNIKRAPIGYIHSFLPLCFRLLNFTMCVCVSVCDGQCADLDSASLEEGTLHLLVTNRNEPNLKF